MIETNFPKSTHPEENILHEYLDEALDTQTRALVETHLAVCPACQNEVAALRSLFHDLETLPKVGLTRDLTPRVLDTLGAETISWQTGRWLALLQVIMAGTVLVLSWPQVLQQAANLELGNWITLGRSWLIRSLETFAVATAAWSLQANDFLDQAISALREPLDIVVPGFNIWPWIAAIGFFWLLVNGLVLRPTGDREPSKTANGAT